MQDGRLSVCVPLSSLSSTTHTSCFRTALPVAFRVPGGPSGVALRPAQLAPCYRIHHPRCARASGFLTFSPTVLPSPPPTLPFGCIQGWPVPPSVFGATRAASQPSARSKLIFLLDKRRPKRVALPGPQATKDRWTKHLDNPWWPSAPCRTSFKTGNCP